IPLWWSLLAAVTGPFGAIVFCLLGAWPLAVLLGFLAGTKKGALAAAVELIFLLSVALGSVTQSGFPQAYFVLGTPLAGGLAWLGESLRRRYRPPQADQRGVSRQDLLNLLFTLQRQLEGQKKHCAFLSLDVVGSSEMKR